MMSVHLYHPKSAGVTFPKDQPANVGWNLKRGMDTDATAFFNCLYYLKERNQKLKGEGALLKGIDFATGGVACACQLFKIYELNQHFSFKYRSTGTS
jgi:hypothetical protein